MSTTCKRLYTKLLAQNKALFPGKINLKEFVDTFLITKKEQNLEVSLESLLASFIHMSVNGCFKSKQRLHEMLLYDFLSKKNKSKFMRYEKNEKVDHKTRIMKAFTLKLINKKSKEETNFTRKK